MSLKKIHEIKVGDRGAVRVYRDSEYGHDPYQIRLYIDGKFREAQTSYETDRDSALGTASAEATWLRKRLNVRENPRSRASRKSSHSRRSRRGAAQIEILFANKTGHIVLAKVRGMKGVSAYLIKRVSKISPKSRRGEKLLLRYTKTGRVVDVTKEMWAGIKEFLPLCRARANPRGRSRRSCR